MIHHPDWRQGTNLMSLSTLMRIGRGKEIKSRQCQFGSIGTGDRKTDCAGLSWDQGDFSNQQCIATAVHSHTAPVRTSSPQKAVDHSLARVTSSQASVFLVNLQHLQNGNGSLGKTGKKRKEKLIWPEALNKHLDLQGILCSEQVAETARFDVYTRRPRAPDNFFQPREEEA